MKIIKYHPKKQFVEIEWRDEICKISIECALKHKIDVFKEIPEETIPQLLAESEDFFALEYLYTQLDKYFKTKKMYYRKLLEKGFSKKSAQYAVDTAEANGFIDDRYFAERFIELNSAKKGKFALKRDLSAKGVSAEIIDELLAETPLQTEELYRLAKKLHKGENTPEAKATLYRKLLSRGFQYDEINAVIKRIFSEDDEF